MRGGGSGGGGKPVSNNPQGGTEEPTPPRTQANTDLVIPTIPPSALPIANIARARARPGSVTQSSNVGGDGITLDQIILTDKEDFTLSNKDKWRYEYAYADVDYVNGYKLGLNYIILDNDHGYLSNDDNGFTDVGGGDESRNKLSQYGFNKRFQGRIIESSDVSNYAFPSGYYRDKDYLTMGYWTEIKKYSKNKAVQISDRGIISLIEKVGVFVTGGDPFNNMPIEGEATYQGLSQIFYFENVTNSNRFLKSELLDSSLNVDFDSGIISGKIGELNLNNAKIGNSNSGFFEGNLTGTFDGRSYNGLYGGQFYGNGESDGKPGTVAGTLGGISSDGRFTIMGTWFGDK